MRQSLSANIVINMAVFRRGNQLTTRVGFSTQARFHFSQLPLCEQLKKTIKLLLSVALINIAPF